MFANPTGLAIPPCYGRSTPSDFESHPQFSLAESKRPSWQHEPFAVADESSRKFIVLYESVVSVAIRCIFMRFSERFLVTLVADQTLSLQPSIFICI